MMFSEQVVEVQHLLLPLLAGHLVGDFVLQPDWMVAKKDRWLVVLSHAAIVAFTSWILLGYYRTWWWLIPYIFVIHLLIDLAKITAATWLKTNTPGKGSAAPSNVEHSSAGAGNGGGQEGNPERVGAGSIAMGPVEATVSEDRSLLLFSVDQLAHVASLITLVAIAVMVPRLDSTLSGKSLWLGLFGTGYLRVLVIFSGWIVASIASGFFFGHFLTRFEDELTPAQKEGLPKGGFWIGVTERSLIYLFILVGEPAGIGFLAAAKSVFRIGELRESEDRKLAEYILIGTLMSFAAAMAIGLLTARVLQAMTG